MSKYEQKKQEVRQEAIDYQNDFANNNYSYGEIADRQSYFEKKGRRYGLLREFHENGII